MKSGAVTVGKWVKLAYGRVVSDLDAGRWRYDDKKAHRAIRFVENFCHHSEERHDLLTLELWQRALLSVIFGVVGGDGYRRFREVFVVVARKNGKTLFAAAIMAYITFVDGGYGAKAYCLAPKLEQADLVYDAYYQIVSSEPELSELTKKRRSDIYIAETNTSVKRLAFNSKKSDGFNPSLVVCDEVEAWPGEPGLRQYEVMQSALGARREPLLFSISTAGYVDGGIYDELYRRATSYLLGGDEVRYFPLLYVIDDIEKWDDIEELKKSNPNLDVSVPREFYAERIKVAKNSLSAKAEYLCKYCNVKQNASVAWLSYEDVDGASRKNFTLGDFRSCYCVGGVDLSQTTDLTAASAVIERDRTLYVFTQFFMPRERLAKASADEGVPYEAYVRAGYLTLSGEHFVDYRDVHAWFLRLVREFEIRPLYIGYDRYSSQYLVAELNSSGFRTDDVFQGTNLSPILKEFEGMLKEGRVEIGQNQLLKAHLLNTAVAVNSGDGRMKPVKIEPRLHIDGAASVFDALTVRSKYYSEVGQMLANERGKR